MPDKADVIDRMEIFCENFEGTDCAFNSACGETFDLAVGLMRCAIALLKEQEPVEYVVHCNNADLSNGTEFACGECGGSLLHKKVNYCPWCGKAVKWG